MNLNAPGISGEMENLSALRESYPALCQAPVAVECVTSEGRGRGPLWDTGKYGAEQRFSIFNYTYNN